MPGPALGVAELKGNVGYWPGKQDTLFYGIAKGLGHCGTNQSHELPGLVQC